MYITISTTKYERKNKIISQKQNESNEIDYGISPGEHRFIPQKRIHWDKNNKVNLLF